MSSVFNRNRFKSLVKMFDDVAQRDIAFNKANLMLASAGLTWVDIIDSDIMMQADITSSGMETDSSEEVKENKANKIFSFAESLLHKYKNTQEKTDIKEQKMNNIFSVMVTQSKISPITYINNVAICHLKMQNNKILHNVYFLDPNDILFIERNQNKMYNLKVKLKFPISHGEHIVATIIKD